MAEGWLTIPASWWDEVYGDKRPDPRFVIRDFPAALKEMAIWTDEAVAQRAEAIRLTAEVERLRGEKAEVASMAWELVRVAQSVPHDPILLASMRSRLAALALPTPVLEAKDA